MPTERRESLPALLRRVRACQMCAAHLPLGPRPVLQAARGARILLASQAPGRKVHDTGIPFNDASGERLRDWLGVSREQFYDPQLFAILPMGFCYPGKGTSGDLPPRPECAPAWRAPLLARLPRLELTLVIGQYALAWHLPDAPRNLTEAVRGWRAALDGAGPHTLALPHPSPRNNGWFKHNPWFADEVLPSLRAHVAQLLQR